MKADQAFENGQQASSSETPPATSPALAPTPTPSPSSTPNTYYFCFDDASKSPSKSPWSAESNDQFPESTTTAAVLPPSRPASANVDWELPMMVAETYWRSSDDTADDVGSTPTSYVMSAPSPSVVYRVEGGDPATITYEIHHDFSTPSSAISAGKAEAPLLQLRGRKSGTARLQTSPDDAASRTLLTMHGDFAFSVHALQQLDQAVPKPSPPSAPPSRRSTTAEAAAAAALPVARGTLTVRHYRSGYLMDWRPSPASPQPTEETAPSPTSHWRSAGGLQPTPPPAAAAAKREGSRATAAVPRSATAWMADEAMSPSPPSTDSARRRADRSPLRKPPGQRALPPIALKPEALKAAPEPLPFPAAPPSAISGSAESASSSAALSDPSSSASSTASSEGTVDVTLPTFIANAGRQRRCPATPPLHRAPPDSPAAVAASHPASKRPHGTTAAVTPAKAAARFTPWVLLDSDSAEASLTSLTTTPARMVETVGDGGSDEAVSLLPVSAHASLETSSRTLHDGAAMACLLPERHSGRAGRGGAGPVLDAHGSLSLLRPSKTRKRSARRRGSGSLSHDLPVACTAVASLHSSRASSASLASSATSPARSGSPSLRERSLSISHMGSASLRVDVSGNSVVVHNSLQNSSGTWTINSASLRSLRESSASRMPGEAPRTAAAKGGEMQAYAYELACIGSTEAASGGGNDDPLHASTSEAAGHPAKAGNGAKLRDAAMKAFPQLPLSGKAKSRGRPKVSAAPPRAPAQAPTAQRAPQRERNAEKKEEETPNSTARTTTHGGEAAPEDGAVSQDEGRTQRRHSNADSSTAAQAPQHPDAVLHTVPDPLPLVSLSQVESRHSVEERSANASAATSGAASSAHKSGRSRGRRSRSSKHRLSRSRSSSLKKNGDAQRPVSGTIDASSVAEVSSLGISASGSGSQSRTRRFRAADRGPIPHCDTPATTPPALTSEKVERVKRKTKSKS